MVCGCCLCGRPARGAGGERGEGGEERYAPGLTWSLAVGSKADGVRTTTLSALSQNGRMPPLLTLLF